MILRPYQEEAVAKALDFFRGENSKDFPLIVASTGSGKSLIIARIAHELKENVLILCPSKELLSQNYEKFTNYGGEAGIYSASLDRKEVGAVTFATIGSIKKEQEKFSHIRYIIIDEADRCPPSSESMFMTFLAGLQDVKVIGLTATPFRLKSYMDPFTFKPFSKINLLPRERPRFFNTFLYVSQIEDLYAQQYLCPIKYLPVKFDKSKLKLNSTGAEYTELSIEKAISHNRIMSRLPDLIRQAVEKDRKHILVFVRSIADAARLASIVPNSSFVSSETPKKDRELILGRFKSGEIKVIFNVAILQVGFDFPALDTIILARPTMSLGLYYQMIGRCMRLSDGKKYSVVVDLCGNYERFGKVEELYFENDIVEGWRLINKNTRKVLSGVRMSEM